jgi:hypothetical protein
MDRFGESNPLLDTLYESVVGRRYLVMTPYGELVKRPNGFEDFDRLSDLFVFQILRVGFFWNWRAVLHRLDGKDSVC